MDNAFRYIKANGGIDTETSYPYEATNDNCRYNPSNAGATDTGKRCVKLEGFRVNLGGKLLLVQRPPRLRGSSCSGDENDIGPYRMRVGL